MTQDTEHQLERLRTENRKMVIPFECLLVDCRENDFLPLLLYVALFVHRIRFLIGHLPAHVAISLLCWQMFQIFAVSYMKAGGNSACYKYGLNYSFRKS